jgi:hypothetical protein
MIFLSENKMLKFINLGSNDQVKNDFLSGRTQNNIAHETLFFDNI